MTPKLHWGSLSHNALGPAALRLPPLCLFSSSRLPSHVSLSSSPSVLTAAFLNFLSNSGCRPQPDRWGPLLYLHMRLQTETRDSLSQRCLEELNSREHLHLNELYVCGTGSQTQSLMRTAEMCTLLHLKEINLR